MDEWTIISEELQALRKLVEEGAGNKEILRDITRMRLEISEMGRLDNYHYDLKRQIRALELQINDLREEKSALKKENTALQRDKNHYETSCKVLEAELKEQRQKNLLDYILPIGGFAIVITLILIGYNILSQL